MRNISNLFSVLNLAIKFKFCCLLPVLSAQINTWRYILISSSQYILESVKLNKFLIEVDVPASKCNLKS